MLRYFVLSSGPRGDPSVKVNVSVVDNGVETKEQFVNPTLKSSAAYRDEARKKWHWGHHYNLSIILGSCGDSAYHCML
jgi:hypothetical protein